MPPYVKRIEAEYFSPLDVHGANPKGKVEVDRGQSVKGTFRWFFRTVTGRITDVEGVRGLDFLLNGSPSSGDVVGHASPWSLSIKKAGRDRLLFQIVAQDKDVYSLVTWMFPYFLALSGYGKRHRHGYGSFSASSLGLSEDELLKFPVEVEGRVREFAQRKGIRIRGNSFERFPVLYGVWVANEGLADVKRSFRGFLEEHVGDLADRIRFLGGVRIRDKYSGKYKYSTAWGRQPAEKLKGLREQRIPSRVLFRKIANDKTAIVLLSIPGVRNWRQVYDDLLKRVRR